MGQIRAFVTKLTMLRIRVFWVFFWTQIMSHLRAFVANQVLSRMRTFLGLFYPDFYSDIEDFTQILCRFLPKKLVAKTSGRHTLCPLSPFLDTMISQIRTFEKHFRIQFQSMNVTTMFTLFDHTCPLGHHSSCPEKGWVGLIRRKVGLVRLLLAFILFLFQCCCHQKTPERHQTFTRVKN